jgi:hypothetical protein
VPSNRFLYEGSTRTPNLQLLHTAPNFRPVRSPRPQIRDPTVEESALVGNSNQGVASQMASASKSRQRAVRNAYAAVDLLGATN